MFTEYNRTTTPKQTRLMAFNPRWPG